NGMIMVGSVKDTEYGRLLRQPRDVGGETQTVYVVVADVAAHYARARKAGAEIVIDIKDEDYGGRDYTCRDPEGHIWTFGSYDPWPGDGN
ncbi:MAG: VOC family protein, partial [Xanthobacteraceae bacterium]